MFHLLLVCYKKSFEQSKQWYIMQPQREALFRGNEAPLRDRRRVLQSSACYFSSKRLIYRV